MTERERVRMDALFSLEEESQKLRFLASVVSYWDEFGEDEEHLLAMHYFLHGAADRIEQARTELA